jgi:hypothetical protein
VQEDVDCAARFDQKRSKTESPKHGESFMRTKVLLVLGSTVLFLSFSRQSLALGEGESRKPIVPELTPTATLTVSTVPANGDVNPYGVAFVPRGFPKGGSIRSGDILVSNFNNSGNQQATGTTIVAATPSGQASVFFQGPATPGALGLTTALGVLRDGFVLVGSVPTLDGTPATVQAPGKLLILDRHGNEVLSLSDAKLLDGPWDLTILDESEHAAVFVSNVLSGGVTRLELDMSRDHIKVESATQIASGYLTRTDPAALLIGPTGLAYDAERDILYVASTGDNAVFAIDKARRRRSDAGMGKLIYRDNAHLRGPLALVLAPNGDLITSNGDAVNPDPTQPSEIVEFTRSGRFVAQMPVDSSGQQGGAFGIALAVEGDQVHFAAVDDISNTLEIWVIR